MGCKLFPQPHNVLTTIYTFLTDDSIFKHFFFFKMNWPTNFHLKRGSKSKNHWSQDIRQQLQQFKILQQIREPFGPSTTEKNKLTTKMNVAQRTLKFKPSSNRITTREAFLIHNVPFIITQNWKI